MNADKKIGNRTLRLLLCFLILGSGMSHSAEPANEAGPAGQTGGESYLGEATKAVVGRVFGVEGEAGDIQYHVVDMTAHSPKNAALRSLAIPGWGQYFNNQKMKGAIFFLGAVGATVGSFHALSKSGESYDEYKEKGVKDDTLYDDYSQEKNRAAILGLVAIVLWSAGIYDAYKNAYSPLYSKNPAVEVAFSDDGAELVLKKSF